MRNRTRLLTTVSVLVIMIGVIFFLGKPQPSSGQQAQPTVDLNGAWKYMDGALLNIAHDLRTGKVTAKFDTPYPCPSGYATIDNLFNGQLKGAELSGRWLSCNDKLLVDACAKGPTYDGDFTATVSYTKMAGHYRLPYFTWTGACQGLKESTTDPYLPLTLTRRDCDPDEDPACNCQPPSRTPGSPWLDPDVPCGKRERGSVGWKQILGTRDVAYTVKLCGETINYVLINGAGRGKERRPPGARSFDVCCESWRNAADSKSPCDARKDIDCDGEINEIDRFPDFPLDTRTGSDFFVMKAPPWPADAGEKSNPPWEDLHAPDQSECKDCKWELIGYEFTTKKIPDVAGSDYSGVPLMDTEYRFKTLWKCPVTGQTKENYEVVTRRDTPPVRPQDVFHVRG